MKKPVFDASALLAMIRREPTIPLDDLIGMAIISSVNFTEVLSKVSDLPADDFASLRTDVLQLVSVVDFTREHAMLAADLRPVTRHLGLSLGDRCCLALAISTDSPVYTADRVWLDLVLPCDVRSIRSA